MSNKTFLSSLWLWSYFKNWRQTTKRPNAITDAFFIPNVPNFPFVLFSLLSFKAGLLATSSLSFSSSENVFISPPAWEAFHWIENSELTPALSTLNVPATSFRPPEFLEWQDSIIWNVPVQVVFHFSLATFKMPLVFNSLRSVWASMSLGSLSLLGGFSAVISEVFKAPHFLLLWPWNSSQSFSVQIGWLHWSVSFFCCLHSFIESHHWGFSYFVVFAVVLFSFVSAVPLWTISTFALIPSVVRTPGNLTALMVHHDTTDVELFSWILTCWVI